MLSEKFEEQVKKTPGNIALKSPDQTFTYMELNRYAQRIAHAVSTAAAGEIAGLLFDHGIPMIAAILGTLKAGKTYVPLSSDYPQQRLAYMLSNSEASLIVTGTANKALAQELARDRNIPVLDIETCKADPVFPAANFSKSIPGEKIAYIMYTSGSTGRPKGVMQTHQNVLYYTRNWARIFSITPGDKVILLASFCHDISVQDIFSALLTGAALLPFDVKKQGKTGEFRDFLIAEKITMWHSVPTLFRYFVNTLTGSERFKGLRFIQLGGERVRGHDIDMVKKHFPNAGLAVIYGQTESSVNAIFFIREGENYEKPLLGTPLAGTRLYVVDEEGSPVKPFRSGEILAASHHISPGYWKNPETTGEVFDRDDDLGRLYWTGDRGRLLVDGSIEFLGRKDHQVKIRGYRIEPGEIETQLLRHEYIKEVVVMPITGEAGETFLAAYFAGAGAGESSRNTPTPGEKSCNENKNFELSNTALREYLARELPDYMIPAYFVELEQIPLTASGKVDRQALPLPQIKVDQAYAAPTDEIEEKLVDIWSQVLQLEKSTLSVNDNFFELGGHSLNAMIITAKIHKAFNISVPLPEIFKTPNIPGLARYIKMSIKDQKKYTPIPAVEKKEYHVLSPAQKRLYIMQMLDPGGTSYNMPEVHILEQELPGRKLEDIFNLLIKKHESPRTSFIFVGEKPVQRINEAVEVKVEVGDSEGTRGLAPLPIESAAALISSFIRPFDLSKAPLLRVGVTKLENGKHLLMVDIHHIISDALSHWLLVKDFMAVYTGASLPGLRIQYKDYSEWYEKIQGSENEAAALAGSTIKTQRDYWLKEFAGELPELNLPTDFVRPAVQDFSGQSFRFEVEVDKAGALKKLALQKGVTRFMVIMAVYTLMLGKLSGREDIIVGTTTAGRNHTDLDQITGMFVNTLAIRNTIAPGKTFHQLLTEVKEKVLKAFENQDYPFEELVEQVAVDRNVSRNPLFDAMFSFLDSDAGDEKTAAAMHADLNIRPYPHENRTAKFDLTLYGIGTTAGLNFIFEYRSKLFKAGTIERFTGYFKNILAAIIENPGLKLDEIRLISSEEKRQLVYDFNDTAVDYPRDKTLHELFAEQVARTPDHTALAGPGYETPQRNNRSHWSYMSYITCTYRQLHEKSNRLAHLLREKGVMTGDVVGIMPGRSIEMIAGILAILKAGGAYLPIDPEYPPERIDYMLKDSGASILLAEDTENTENTERASCYASILPASRLHLPPATAGSPSTCRVSSSNPAYVIYTSGSTGKPRGVIIENKPVVNFIKGITDVITFSETDRILSLTTLSFDIFVLETVLPLIKGAVVFIGSREQQLNVEAAASVIEREKITIFQVTPSRLQLFIYERGVSQCLKRLKYLLVGGEALPMELLEKTRELTGSEIYNLYGPTETTVWSTIKNVSCNESLNIGKPIANTRVYILDKSGYIQPLGVPGELCIAGVGVARGYLNNPGLTAEKFKIINYELARNNKKFLRGGPGGAVFSKSAPPGRRRQKLYKTGDQALWLPGGEIEFLGRMDFQVKIRGFRVELPEIENYLRSHVKVKEAVVMVKQDGSSEKYLCAIIRGVNGNMPQVGELREFLSRKVPGYMIPSYFIEIEEIPLTPNGKVDRRVLAGYMGNPLCTGTAHVAPGTGIEKVVAELWQEVLKREKVGIHDNFFEIGGNSMNLVQLGNKLQKRLEIENPVVSLFRYPTIHSFLEYLNRGEGEGGIDSERIEESLDDLEETMGILAEE